jgi:hypothetical protein
MGISKPVDRVDDDDVTVRLDVDMPPAREPESSGVRFGSTF